MPLKRPLDLRPFVGGRVGWAPNGLGVHVRVESLASASLRAKWTKWFLYTNPRVGSNSEATVHCHTDTHTRGQVYNTEHCV